MESDIDAATLAALIRLVRQHTGIAMTDKKRILLQGRLRPRIRTLGLAGYDAYLAHLLSEISEIPTFVNLVTTNDTAFFRTPHVWDYFCNQFLPAWYVEHAGKTLQVWSAAAASGEEAYSIAMVCEQFLQQHPDFSYEIFGTDISTEALEAARVGRYTGRSVERLAASHPHLKKIYFTEHGTTLEVLPLLRRHVRFAEHNLLAPLLQHAPYLVPQQTAQQTPKPAQFDIVFLRNVLIYLDDVNQQCVVEQVCKSMRPNARLVLGESETLGRLNIAHRYEMPMVYGFAPASEDTAPDKIAHAFEEIDHATF